jgi:hypothetical protein
MYIIVIDGDEDRGAYSVADENGENVLYIWENEDDVERFIMMLEESGAPKMKSVEVEEDLLFDACSQHGYLYAIIGSDDLVIPPEDHDLF